MFFFSKKIYRNLIVFCTYILNKADTKKSVNKLIKKGIFYIFGLNIFNKLVQFCSNLFMVRILSKHDYGLLSYIVNILSVYLLFNGAGSSIGLLQFGSETKNKIKHVALFIYALRRGLLFSFIIAFVLWLTSIWIPLKFSGSNILLRMTILYPPLIFIIDIVPMMFRISLDNKKYAIVNATSSFSILVFSLLGAYFYNVWGAITFKYIGFILSIIVSIFLLKNYLIKKSDSLIYLSIDEKREFNNYSWYLTATNAISQLLYIIDIFLIGIILGNKSIIATYKVATVIPFALNFIPLSMMTFAYPYFARNNFNMLWLRINSIKLIVGMGFLNFTIASVLYIYAYDVIQLVFGAQYLDAVDLFRILVIGYFVAGTFRIPAGNILASLKTVKFGLYLSIFAGIFNILFDLLMINKMGSKGAAISTLMIFIVTSMATVYYLVIILKKES